MRVHTVGDGDPQIAVVGSIHGDEPCGMRAIDRVLAADPKFTKPVKFIIANERALDRGQRYIDEDLNRVFPGDATSESHEQRLAAQLTAELRGMTVLSIHSTQSYSEAFAIVSQLTEMASRIIPQLPVTAAVTSGRFVEGRLLELGNVIEVEAGLQGSEQAIDNAEAIIWAFLRAMDALDSTEVVDRETLLDPSTAVKTGPRVIEGSGSSVPVFRLVDVVPKTIDAEYQLRAENFQRVEHGDVYAIAGEETIVADHAFYPVLMSANGYEHIIGYVAERIDTID